MKIVINKCYGGFELSEEVTKELGYRECDDSLTVRTDPRLIKKIKEKQPGVSGEFAKLAVVTIPDEATDWMIHDYDGMESIWYVVDGKIHSV